MIERLRKARRILAAQTELDRLAGWTLIDLERRSASLEARRGELVRFLDEESAFGGLFAVAMMRRLQKLEEARAGLRIEMEAQARLRLEERGRMRRAEAIVQALEREVRQRDEAIGLAEAIEAAINRRA